MLVPMGRPKEFDPERAVAEAMEVFWTQGYGATSPQQLADRLRIGKGSLYNAFGGKRQLFDLALRHYLDLRVEGLAHWLEGTAPVKDRLREALLFLLSSDPDTLDRRGCLAINSAVELGRLDEAVATQVRGLFDRVEGVFASLVARGQREGDIRGDVDAKALASVLLNTATGLLVLSRLEPGPDRLTRVVDTTLALL
ncbi:TetR/AcrR family transcriptional regulator [Saccharothrix coeruleofusca]|uniref:TetR family transcriptional regulator n=1 Tax=Saccharothrix coeruleofusca TaxID=33919 RepID=A0A918ARK2_9PSEU|nr:TetR/AcrR family transcriptional regulator [Saccharothrix coeruleofusca]MBP2334637.1 TetR/AcrR family transcriptional repressor of nem operon [Saccharothrix coeruleofusca]GGP73069.1 TetR family transcriptional regulator [Saccharothrix coeruleofusca]